MVIAYAKGAYLNWRLVAWINIVYTLVPVLLIQLFVPESPVWLVSKGRIEDAAKSLRFLYKKYPQPEHTVSKAETSGPFKVSKIKLFSRIKPSQRCISVH